MVGDFLSLLSRLLLPLLLLLSLQSRFDLSELLPSTGRADNVFV